MSTQVTPLHLAFQAREGVEGVCRQRTPLSRNLSEGGVSGVNERNPVWPFERERGMEGVDRGNTPPSRVSSEGGVEGCIDREPLCLAI